MTALQLVRKLERTEAALGIDTYVPGPEPDPLANPAIQRILRTGKTGRPRGNPRPGKGKLVLPSAWKRHKFSDKETL